MTTTALALEPELIEHEVDAAMAYLETEWWLEGVDGRRSEFVESTRRPVAPSPGDCDCDRGSGSRDGNAMCELCWQQVPTALSEALARAWRQQREPSNPERREQYRLALDLCIAEASETN